MKLTWRHRRQRTGNLEILAPTITVVPNLLGQVKEEDLVGRSQQKHLTNWKNTLFNDKSLHNYHYETNKILIHMQGKTPAQPSLTTIINSDFLRATKTTQNLQNRIFLWHAHGYQKWIKTPNSLLGHSWCQNTPHLMQFYVNCIFLTIAKYSFFYTATVLPKTCVSFLSHNFHWHVL